MDKKIVAHFQRVDPVIHQAMLKLDGVKGFEKRDPAGYFVDLVESIISQQLSGKAAATIFERFKRLFSKGKITPEAISKLDQPNLRAVGMSNAKASFIKDLAEQILDQKLDLTTLDQLTDEQVLIELTKVKGIGKWTAEMFLLFCLGREDVFSAGDQGLKNAMKKLYCLENPTELQLVAIATSWRPYRSYACRILWSSLDKV